MAVIMQPGQAVLVTAEVVDAAGRQAPVEGLPLWVSSSADVVVSPYPDGMGCHIAVKDTATVQTATITVSADADLSAAVRTISATLDVEVGAVNRATEIRLVVGTPY